MIIGWSLINSTIHTKLYLELQERIKFFKEANLLNPEHKVALGQKFLDYKYRGKGIVEKMTSLQDNLAAGKYDIYMATVKKDNKPSEFFFKKNSFVLFFEDDVRYFFSKLIRPSEKAIQQSISIIVEDIPVNVLIRPAEGGDEFELHEQNKKWLKEARVTDMSKGFLTTLYSTEQFRKIIDNSEIVVAEISNNL